MIRFITMASGFGVFIHASSHAGVVQAWGPKSVERFQAGEVSLTSLNLSAQDEEMNRHVMCGAVVNMT